MASANLDRSGFAYKQSAKDIQNKENEMKFYELSFIEKENEQLCPNRHRS